MQIVFAHYHLNPGGVTQVVTSQILALATLPEGQRPHRIGVLYGGRKEGWPDKLWTDDPPLEVVLLPVTDLDYDRVDVPSSDSLVRQVLHELATHGFMADDTLLHIHNHALGKNVSWPYAVRSLAEHRYRILLQIHDFAEDFRPANYRRMAQALGTDEPSQLAQAVYPQSPSTFYGALTNRDADVLRRAGVANDQLYVLPNPAAEFAELPSHEEVAASVRTELGIPRNSRLVLYPVRGIRRKNVGELLLYSALSTKETWHAVTLAPQNPAELPSFERWRTMAEELGLRTLFDICGCGEPSFHETLAASDWLITTSVAEGFGMVFLEAWLVGKQLVGRRLPGITDDFEAAGLQFNGLRESLDVPLAWLSSRAKLAEALYHAYTRVCEDYGIDPDPVQEAHARQMAGNDQQVIDFGLLPSKFQQHIIRHAAADPEGARAELEAINPGITTIWPNESVDDGRIAANAAVVRSTYSLPTIGRRMYDVYQNLAASPLGGWQPLAHGEAILQSFLKVDRLHAIRFEE